MNLYISGCKKFSTSRAGFLFIPKIWQTCDSTEDFSSQSTLDCSIGCAVHVCWVTFAYEEVGTMEGDFGVFLPTTEKKLFIVPPVEMTAGAACCWIYNTEPTHCLLFYPSMLALQAPWLPAWLSDAAWNN